MISSQPKLSSILAISFFLAGMLVVTTWLMVGLISNPTSYFLLKLILAPTSFVIVITIAIKSYFTAIIITLGNNKLTYRHLLGTENSYNFTEITSWKEEVIKRKKSEYRSLTIQLSNNKKLRISNHENSHYQQIVTYLKKKIRTKNL